MKMLAAMAALSAVLLTGCSGPPSASAPTVTVTATTTVTAAAAPLETVAPAPTATPTPVKTSGNYGADLAAAGVIPDSVSRYAKFMEESFCDAPLTIARPFKYTHFSNSVRTQGSGADDVAATRLSVAYFCPERAELAEAALKEHGYIK